MDLEFFFQKLLDTLLFLFIIILINFVCIFTFLGIPEITKDSASENYSEEDDPTRRGRGMVQGQRYGYRGDPYAPRTPEVHRSTKTASTIRQDPYYDQTGKNYI